MKRSRLLVISLILATLCVFLVPGSALGDEGGTPLPQSVEPRQVRMGGTWIVDVHWYNPEIIGEYDLYVRMITPSLGVISTSGEHTGILLTDGTRVLWTIDRPWFALYFGTLSGSTASGRMINREGNYGDWSAVKVAASEELSLPSRPGVALGVRGSD